MKNILMYCFELVTEDTEQISKNKYLFLFNLLILKPILYVLLCISIVCCFVYLMTGFGVGIIIGCVIANNYIPAIILFIIDFMLLILYIKEKLKDYERK